MTNRRAVQFEALAESLWGDMGSPERRRLATAGLFAVGAFARERDIVDAPPLISSRIHMMFRGIPGIWACMNPTCPSVGPEFRHLAISNRPVGKLYTEPTPWCECGSRVLEIFTCRVCGLMFLGGIPDLATGSLWPWTDDLESGRPDMNDFVIFGVEEPSPTLNRRSGQSGQRCEAVPVRQTPAQPLKSSVRWWVGSKRPFLMSARVVTTGEAEVRKGERL